MREKGAKSTRHSASDESPLLREPAQPEGLDAGAGRPAAEEAHGGPAPVDVTGVPSFTEKDVQARERDVAGAAADMALPILQALQAEIAARIDSGDLAKGFQGMTLKELLSQAKGLLMALRRPGASPAAAGAPVQIFANRLELQNASAGNMPTKTREMQWAHARKQLEANP